MVMRTLRGRVISKYGFNLVIIVNNYYI
jgi:hypothetical protein